MTRALTADDLLARIERREDVGACWEYQGPLNSEGYGTVGRALTGEALAHRAVYALLVGPIPDGHTLDHTCHTADRDCTASAACTHRRCVNVSHLEPVLQVENARRSAGRAGRRRGPSRRTVCVKGHSLLDVDNVYVKPDGRRECRTCKADRWTRWRDRNIHTQEVPRG